MTHRPTDPQNFRHYLALVFIVMINLTLYAQDTLPTVQYYYVEEKAPDLLKPTSKNRLADHSLDLSFSNSNLQTFFNSKTVYVYKKAFPGAINKRLQNMYLVGFDDFNLVNPLRSLNEIVYSDYIGDLEYENLSVPPADYESIANIPTQYVAGNPASGLPNEHLDLVNAKQAWNITTGDPNVVIGIVDGPFYPNHPDLINKILQHYGSVWNPTPGVDHQHGTKVAGCLPILIILTIKVILLVLHP
ncbi:hypothetical protein [Flavobacterium sp. CS20]|uniref:hypothetical protein n=1 Tax=Flavobacterium sp. CS20 TaxID=2775246 RepID=UPI001B3A36D0|nr:hypothetical protein [Flavobacterium sp. CS20]QTY26337.1 hypothetical protein IGB25_10330 [Flavobacterium sp. CS20]